MEDQPAINIGGIQLPLASLQKQMDAYQEFLAWKAAGSAPTALPSAGLGRVEELVSTLGAQLKASREANSTMMRELTDTVKEQIKAVEACIPSATAAPTPLEDRVAVLEDAMFRMDAAVGARIGALEASLKAEREARAAQKTMETGFIEDMATPLMKLATASIEKTRRDLDFHAKAAAARAVALDAIHGVTLEWYVDETVDDAHRKRVEKIVEALRAWRIAEGVARAELGMSGQSFSE